MPMSKLGIAHLSIIMDSHAKICAVGHMKISFSRHDRYPGADIEIELIESGRIPTMVAWFKLSTSGSKNDRELLRSGLTEWSKRRRINIRSRCDAVFDTHEAYLRHWTHVSEFMSYWVGDQNFSRMLEDASRTNFRHEFKLQQIAEEIARLKPASVDLEQRIAAAARAFLGKSG